MEIWFNELHKKSDGNGLAELKKKLARFSHRFMSARKLKLQMSEFHAGLNIFKTKRIEERVKEALKRKKKKRKKIVCFFFRGEEKEGMEEVYGIRLKGIVELS